MFFWLFLLCLDVVFGYCYFGVYRVIVLLAVFCRCVTFVITLIALLILCWLCCLVWILGGHVVWDWLFGCLLLFCILRCWFAWWLLLVLFTDVFGLDVGVLLVCYDAVILVRYLLTVVVCGCFGIDSWFTVGLGWFVIFIGVCDVVYCGLFVTCLVHDRFSVYLLVILAICGCLVVIWVFCCFWVKWLCLLLVIFVVVVLMFVIWVLFSLFSFNSVVLLLFLDMILIVAWLWFDTWCFCVLFVLVVVCFMFVLIVYLLLAGCLFSCVRWFALLGVCWDCYCVSYC